MTAVSGFQNTNIYRKTTAAFRFLRYRVMRSMYAGGRSALTENVSLIEQSQIFDADAYRQKHPWMRDTKASSIEHYLVVGHHKNYSPSDYFDTAYYRMHNSDELNNNTNPLIHYLTEGWRENRNPHPSFDIKYYLDNNPDIVEGEVNPLTHFVTQGRKEGRQAHPDHPNLFRTYTDWLEENTLSPQELEDQRTKQIFFEHRPIVSFITPIFHPPLNVLQETIESVIAQTYSNWELILTNASIGNNDVKKLLDQYARTDTRIKVFHLDENLGISGNSNVGISHATGEFIAIFDHDDLLAPNMLFEVVEAINQNENPDIIYFDEDKIDDETNKRKDPNFKPAYSPELLLSTNYLMHSVIRHSLVETVGLFDATTDGAQDWDLLLRCTEHTQAIIHIPKILYHWRMVAGSTAGQYNAKPYAQKAQTNAIKKHLERQGHQNVSVKYSQHAVIHIKWDATQPLTSIIIPTKDNPQCLQNCLKAIAATNYPHCEIIVVDNSTNPQITASQDLKNISPYPITFVPYKDTFNYSHANNLGASHAQGDHLLFLNDDVSLYKNRTDWLDELLQWSSLPEIGIVGAKLLYPSHKIQHAGVVVGMTGHANHLYLGVNEDYVGLYGLVNWYRNLSAVTGACQMIKRDLFNQIGGYDESFQLAFSDIEICQRVLNNGYRILINPHAQLMHHEGYSRDGYIPPQDIQIGYEKFADWIKTEDQYYNPNLSRQHLSPQLRFKNEIAPIDRLQKIVEQYKINALSHAV